MNYILFDPPNIERFYPFSLTRPLGEMRIFGGTIKQNWEKILGTKISYLTATHLSELYPVHWSDENILICSSCIPDIKNLKKYSIHSGKSELNEIQKKWIELQIESHLIYKDLIDILFNIQKNDFFLREKSTINCFKNSFLNDEDGPIVIEEDVTIMEGVMIKGPVHICKGSVIKMGAKIYGPTLIGPYCKIGGEVSNSIFLGYSNKAHEGFLGHSIIGEWCNIGAGTSNSNLKNNYDTVKIWDYESKKFLDSMKQFLGLYMGDHSKCAINTSFNTGTIIGINCNIFGTGFPRNYIPSFSWGGPSGYKEYNIDKAIETAKIVMKRRNIEMSAEYEKMLRKVFNMTVSFRS
mgnify:CR=1 FL=1